MGGRVGWGGVVFVCGYDGVDNGGACGLSRSEKDGKTPFFISEHRPTHGLMPPFSTARGSVWVCFTHSWHCGLQVWRRLCRLSDLVDFYLLVSLFLTYLTVILDVILDCSGVGDGGESV